MSVPVNLWLQSVDFLRDELPAQHFNTWIRPLQVESAGGRLLVYAPNRFVMDWVNDKYFTRLLELMTERNNGEVPDVSLLIGSRNQQPAAAPVAAPVPTPVPTPVSQPQPVTSAPTAPASAPAETAAETKTVAPKHVSNLNRSLTFDSFIEGKSNQLARAAAWQVADNPSHGYNPLFLYGGVGLGKTHLMHAIGNHRLPKKPGAPVIYLHSERFVADMVKALQMNAINEFKSYYRPVHALLIDDIQFFAGKERSQEEFFHTFNALLEGHQQIILSSDRYPKEVNGLEERLKSRFGWGLTVAIEPPELETRVAILVSKASSQGVELPHGVAFFIAKRIRSNIRELEGALRRVIANSQFTGQPITVDFTKEALRDLLALQDKLVTIDNIQKMVAEYYKIRVADLLSKRRNRSITRPRQLAMALAKELTNHSLPEIGDAFGGRDHTTVLHACRKVEELREQDPRFDEDYANLLRTLTT